jgi:membrane fusion protein (multidrug efflux system)
MSTDTDNEQASSTAAGTTRRNWLLGGGVTAATAALAYGIYFVTVLRHYESTDNAYVQGDLVQITSQVSGTVVSIGADDTDFVRTGQELVSLDRVDAQVALDQAEAQLAEVVREVCSLYASDDTLAAQVTLREADIARAQSDVAKAEDDVQRRATLSATGAVGKEEFNHATAQLASSRSALATAQAALVVARRQLLSNKALTRGTTPDAHPNVQRAAARVRESYVALHRTLLPAPVDGYVAKRGVQVGQRVAPGAPLMSVVPLRGVWVDANFKESQLQRLRLGQPVSLHADVYGDRVEYHGHVAGLGAGTGSAFSLLPAQNATGNWIKIVQRVPVRIELQADELVSHPLRVGLSMNVTVDVHDVDGKMLADSPRSQPIASTTVFDQLQRDADDRVRQIIVANGVVRALALRSTRTAADAHGVPAVASAR